MADNGTIVYYLTMAESCNVVDIAYDGNNADAGTMGAVGTGVIHTGVKDGDNISLIASNFSRDGYGFAGWSFDQNAGTKLIDNDNTNNPVVYGPQETITIPTGITTYDTDNDGIVKLYAVWIESQGNLQGWTGCSAMTATTYDSTTGKLTVAKNSITALTDQRDNQVYAIAKLADENCWMVENLRLDDSSELTTTNTNINNVIFNHLSATSSTWCYTANSCVNSSRLNTSNTQFDITPSQTQNITSANNHAYFNNNIYGYGNYYNWYSATAGYGDLNETTSAPTNGDLCPAGWKLPYGSTGTSGINIGGIKGGFYYLASQMNATASNRVNSIKFRMFPNNFIYSGYWYYGWAYNRGASGGYWSASASDSSGAYILNLGVTSIRAGDYGEAKYDGNSVRCISKTN